MSAPRWIAEADVVALLDLPAAIAAVRRGLAQEARGTAQNMVKTHVRWSDGDTLHAIGAVFGDDGLAGTKTWAHTAGGATPLLVLFDAASGALRAVIEAFALGQLRTGAVSGVATDILADPAADELALIGSGRQAMAQVAAVRAVRRLRRVRVFSPTAAHAAGLAARAAVIFDLPVDVAETLDAAVHGAPMVTVATRARVPFVSGASLARGAHVNAIGAITPERAELTADVLPRCSVVTADSVAAAQRLSRELRDHFGESGDWSAVRPLCELVAADASRPADADLTLLKAMGTGVSDLSVGIEVLRRAERAGRGREVPAPTKAELFPIPPFEKGG
ncbi:MAG: ornithine cyclodeaminase family protein [Deltaproteobacteria bacterium]|nr:ornithine cyclodeaminase family protein [Deltaproteobacteria bacterium]